MVDNNIEVGKNISENTPNIEVKTAPLEEKININLDLPNPALAAEAELIKKTTQDKALNPDADDADVKMDNKTKNDAILMPSDPLEKEIIVAREFKKTGYSGNDLQLLTEVANSLLRVE